MFRLAWVLAVLALSPIVFIGGYLVALMADVFGATGLAWVAVSGYVAAYGPLLLLGSFGPFVPGAADARLLTRLALGAGLLVIPGIVFSRATEFVVVSDPANPRVALEQLPGRANAFRISGLNVRWGPEIQKGPPGAGFDFVGDMSHAGGSSGWAVSAARPTFEKKDGYGNSLSFQLIRVGVVRVEDNLGGFAEIDWNGAAPILAASRAVLRSASARGPTATGRRLVGFGQLIVFVTPFISWYLFTSALARVVRGSDYAISFWLPRILQIGGLGLFALFAFVSWTQGLRGGEAGMAAAALMFLIGFPAILASAVGTTWMGLLLLRLVIDSELERRWS